MDQELEATSVRRGGIDPFSRLVRIALVVYLSPVILIVLAIGLVGMLAMKVGKPTARMAVEGAHPAHETNRPLGLAKAPARVREMV